MLMCKGFNSSRFPYWLKFLVKIQMRNIWENSNITNIFYICLTKVAWIFLKNRFCNFIFENDEGITFLLSLLKYSIISLLNLNYFQFHIVLFFCSFMLSNIHSLNCKFHFLEKQSLFRDFWRKAILYFK